MITPILGSGTFHAVILPFLILFLLVATLIAAVMVVITLVFLVLWLALPRAAAEVVDPHSP